MTRTATHRLPLPLLFLATLAVLFLGAESVNAGSPPDGTASVQLGPKIPAISKGKIRVPIDCSTEGMDNCEGKIKVFAQAGKKPVARGKFSVPEGKWSATLYPRRKLLRLLDKDRPVPVDFEVTTLQESGERTVRVQRRNIHQR